MVSPEFHMAQAFESIGNVCLFDFGRSLPQNGADGVLMRHWTRIC